MYHVDDLLSVSHKRTDAHLIVQSINKATLHSLLYDIMDGRSLATLTGDVLLPLPVFTLIL